MKAFCLVCPRDVESRDEAHLAPSPMIEWCCKPVIGNATEDIRMLLLLLAVAVTPEMVCYKRYMTLV